MVNFEDLEVGGILESRGGNYCEIRKIDKETEEIITGRWAHSKNQAREKDNCRWEKWGKEFEYVNYFPLKNKVENQSNKLNTNSIIILGILGILGYTILNRKDDKKMAEQMLDKLNNKLEGIIDTLEEKPFESIIKIIILYVIFKQLFKNKQQ